MACSSCGNARQGEVGFTLQTGCFCEAQSFTNPEDVAGTTLIEALGGCVDTIRDIKTQFGARQYDVHLIWTKWTGGKRNAGEEYIYREVHLLPTPAVEDLSGVSKQSTEVGLAEQGTVRVTEISTRFDEGQLLGLIEGQVPGPDVNFYWEIRSPMRGNLGENDIRRRFFPTSAPNFEETQFQWSISLTRAHGDRTPAGLPRRDPTGTAH